MRAVSISSVRRPPERGRRRGKGVHPRRVRVGTSIYQRIDAKTGRRAPGKFEFCYRDSTGRQVWQTAEGDTLAAAKGERAEILARLRLGHRIERTQLTVADVAEQWLERGTGQKDRWQPPTTERYERIVRRCIGHSPDPGLRPLGAVKLSDVTVDDIAAWTGANERTLAPTTAKLALIALNQILRFAARQGWIHANPVDRLEAGEKPRWTPQKTAILEGDDLRRMLDHARRHSTIFEFLAYSGLRIGEALGLCWADIDPENSVIRVHRQLSRDRVHKQLKTPAGRREVVLAPAVAQLLLEHRVASSHTRPDDLVFSNSKGRGLDYRRVGDDFRQAVKDAGIATNGDRLSLHSLRHGYASMLIAHGLNVAFVSRQLGHANPNVTLSVYAHLFEQAEHAAAARQALEASHALMVSVSGPSSADSP